MTATQWLNTEYEQAFKNLLLKYRETEEFSQAYVNFQDRDYVEWQGQILASTSAKNTPVVTLDQAIHAMTITKFLDDNIQYKKYGLITAIAPQYFPEYQVEIKEYAAEVIKREYGKRSTDIWYDSKVGWGTSKAGNKQYYINTWRGPGEGIEKNSAPYKAHIYKRTHFFDPNIINYIINKGIAAGGHDGGNSPYFTLADSLLEWMSLFVGAARDLRDEVLQTPWHGSLVVARFITNIDSHISNASAQISLARANLAGLNPADPPALPVTFLNPGDKDGILTLLNWANEDTLTWGLGDEGAPNTQELLELYIEKKSIWWGRLGAGGGLLDLHPDATEERKQTGRANFAAISEAVKNYGIRLQGFILDVGTSPLDGYIQAVIELETPYKSKDTSGEGADPEQIKSRFVKEQTKRIVGFFGAHDDETQEALERQARYGEGVIPSLAAAPDSLKPKARNLTPLDFQCFLLENISKLTAQRAEEKFASNYKNIIKVDSDAQPATVMNVIGHLGEDVVKEILDICPDVYGLLTPYIKVTRLEYDKLGAPINGSEQELEIPNFLAPEDVASIMSGDLGRASGAGIKSFSWGLEGVQPAEVDNNITANLVMYFQSVKDFFGRSEQAGERKANFLDLVIASPTVSKRPGTDPKTAKSKCSLDEELHRKYDGVNFRIKVCAGWASPPNMREIFPTMAEGKVKALEKAIRSTRVSLFLQQVRHLITFNENGSLEMSIDYQASLSGLLTGKTSDILAPSSEIYTTDIAKLEEDIETLEAKANDGLMDDYDKEQIKEKLDEIVALRGQDRLIKYKKLLKKLFASDKIYNLTVNPTEFLLPPYSELSPEQKAARAKRRRGEGLVIKSSKGNSYTLLSAVGAAASAGTDGAAAGADYSEKESERLNILRSSDPGSLTYIPYFYLGDLLDNILEQIKENNSKKGGASGALTFKFFMSDVEMIDPLLALQVKNLDDAIACGNLRDAVFMDALHRLDPTTFNTGITQLMNIGDIPISVDAFQLWFKNNIVKKDRDKYFFLHFVKDICAYLITSALRSKCFGDSLNYGQRFDAQPLTLNKKKSLFRETTTVAELSKAHTTLTCGTQARDSVLGLILISTDSRPKGLHGHYGPDLRAGIYHHYIGSACGLVKKINFNREDQAYLRESKIQKEGSLGPEQLRELYSAQLDLVGNNLYKNGNYIYISPLLLGATEEQLRLLGLHGYYLVTSVKSTITPNSFDTSITALHEGIKFGASKRLKPLVYEGLEAEGELALYAPPPDPEYAQTHLEAIGRIREEEGDVKVAVVGLAVLPRGPLGKLKMARALAPEVLDVLMPGVLPAGPAAAGADAPTETEVE